nr:DDE-type integrase/transposase/recombinase [Acidobacteriota bacterium]
IYAYMRRYWQAGQIRNALLPAYARSGGKGKRRLARDGEEHTASQLGKPSALARVATERMGVRVTPDIERRFERGIKRYYETKDEHPLTVAYELTLKSYFAEKLIPDPQHIPKPGERHRLKPILPPAERLPTFDQFRYWYERIYSDPVRAHKARHGAIEHELNARAITGDSTQMAFGPGSLYQIDATIADDNLVSALDRTRLIGRPVVYHCVDVFSHAFAGIAVLLEGPSWTGAMLALDNATTDKVVFCAEYGVSITEDEWPCRHLPEGVLADRGEYENYDASNLVNSFGMRVHNTSPYRGDMKGLVERSFGVANERFIKFIPGAVHKRRERGAQDERLEAVLTLDEFRELLIHHVLLHNMDNYMKDYKRDVFMIPDYVAPYPLELWNWGITNRSGHLLERPQEIIRLNLLPRKMCSVTPRGIHFENNLYYTCDTAIREGWFSRARVSRNWRIEVAFDPRSTNCVYLRKDDGHALEQCRLTEASRTFRHQDLQDAQDFFALELQAMQASRSRTLQARVSLHARREQIVGEANEKTELAHRRAGHQSKASRLKGIRANRREERDARRESGAWHLGETDAATATVGDVVPFNGQSEAPDEGYVPEANRTDLFRKLRDKAWRSGTDDTES